MYLCYSNNKHVHFSENHIDLLLGKKNEGRDDVVLEATSRTAYRHGDWVLIPPYPGPKMFLTKGIGLNPHDGHAYLPYIVLVIDEFADLIMTAA